MFLNILVRNIFGTLTYLHVAMSLFGCYYHFFYESVGFLFVCVCVDLILLLMLLCDRKSLHLAIDYCTLIAHIIIIIVGSA